MNNEAYAGQYIDHHVARHPRAESGRDEPAESRRKAGRIPGPRMAASKAPPASPPTYRELMGPAYRDADGIRAARSARPCPRSAFSTRPAARRLQSKAVTLAPGAATSLDVLRPAYHPIIRRRRATPTSRLVEEVERMPRRTGRRARSRSPRRRALSSRTRRPPSPKRSTRRRSGRATAGARMSNASTASRCRSSRRRRTHSRHVVLRDKERIVARRHGALAAQRRGDAAGRRHLVRHRLDARRLRRPAHHRQHVVSQALFRLARSLQHRPRQRPQDAASKRGGWRLLTVPSAFEMGLSDCRWLYRLGERTITVSATCRRRRARHAVARDRRRRKVPLPRLRPSRPRRAGIRPPRPSRNRRADESASSSGRIPMHLWGKQYPHAVLPSGDQHARARRGDRRRRTALRSTGSGAAAATPSIRTRPTSAFVFAVVGSMTDAEAGERAGGEIREARRRSVTCSARRRASGATLTRGIRVKSASSADALAIDTILPLARPRRDDASHRAARPRTIYRRRLGHARRLPGSGRAVCWRSSTTGRSRRSCASSSRSNTR